MPIAAKTIKAACPHCGHSYQFPEHYLDRRARCKGCGKEFMITETRAVNPFLAVKEKVKPETKEPPTQGLYYECPHCDTKTVCSKDITGLKAICRYCNKEFTVSACHDQELVRRLDKMRSKIFIVLGCFALFFGAFHVFGGPSYTDDYTIGIGLISAAFMLFLFHYLRNLYLLIRFQILENSKK